LSTSRPGHLIFWERKPVPNEWEATWATQPGWNQTPERQFLV